MNARREEGAHRLADEVGRRDARDPEPVGGLRGDRRLAGARGAADEEDDRDVELPERVQVPEPPHRAAPLRLAQHLRRELGEPVEVEAVGPALGHVGVGAPRELVRARHGQPGGRERAGHQPLRPGRPVVAAERQRREVAALAHRTASGTSATASAASRSELGVEIRLARSGTTSFAATTTRDAASARLLDDDVDRRRLELDDEDVGVGARELVTQARPVGEAARDVRDPSAVRVLEVRASRACCGSGAVQKNATRSPDTGSSGRGRSTARITAVPGRMWARSASRSSACGASASAIVTTTRSAIRAR